MGNRYVHECVNAHRWGSNKALSLCPQCSNRSIRMTQATKPQGRPLGRPKFQVMREFKPYVEHFEAGKPVVVKNRDHRDELCKAHDKTYDTCTGYGVRPKPAADQITLEEVIEEVKRAPEPERSARKADDPCRDTERTGLEGVGETLLNPISDEGLSR